MLLIEIKVEFNPNQISQLVICFDGQLVYLFWGGGGVEKIIN